MWCLCVFAKGNERELVEDKVREREREKFALVEERKKKRVRVCERIRKRERGCVCGKWSELEWERERGYDVCVQKVAKES